MQRRTSVSWLWTTLDMSIAVTATIAFLLFESAKTSLTSFADVLSMRISVKNFLVLTLFLLLWTGIHQLSGLHFSVRHRRPRRFSARRVIIATALGSLFFLLFPLFSNSPSPDFIGVLLFFAVALCASFAVRYVACPVVL